MNKGGYRMKKLLLGTILLALGFLCPVPTMAAVYVNISIPLPPPIVFLAPPMMVVLPETDVYVAPDYNQDIYFYGDWWWQFWGGRWYRSSNYDSGWEFYNGVPGWYGAVYPLWRDSYREHTWGGQRWDYRSVPYRDVRSNWRNWQSSGYWRTQQNQGTAGSYHQEVETRRDFRGFDQEIKGRQTISVPTPTRQSSDFIRNKSAFTTDVERGSNVRIQSNRGFQSRQSMSSKGGGNTDKGGGANKGKGKVVRPD
jgi:hypothetical protein